MLAILLSTITPDQRAKLADRGIAKQQVTDWKAGRRYPTEVQVIALAEAFDVDRYALQDEVTLLRATPEQRSWLQRAMGKTRSTLTGVSAAVLAGLLVVAASAGSGTDDAKAFARRLRRRRNRANDCSVSQWGGPYRRSSDTARNQVTVNSH